MINESIIAKYFDVYVFGLSEKLTEEAVVVLMIHVRNHDFQFRRCRRRCCRFYSIVTETKRQVELDNVTQPPFNVTMLFS